MEETLKEAKQSDELKENISLISTSALEQKSDVENNSFDDEFESTGEGLLTGVKYDTPDNKDKFIDTNSGSVIDKKDLTPFQIIKAIAKQNNHTIKDPASGCRKCFGRGYEGIDLKTKMPIPCRCLFRGKTEQEKLSDFMYDMKNNPQRISRSQKRRMQKHLLNQFRAQKKLIKNIVYNKEHEVVEQTDEQKKAYIDNILNVYKETKSLKKTAKKLNMTLTDLKKIVKIVRNSNVNENKTDIKE